MIRNRLILAATAAMALVLLAGNVTAAPPRARRQVSLAEILAHADRNAPEVSIARAQLSRGRAEVDATAPPFPADPVLGGSLGRRTRSGQSGIDWTISLEQEIEIAGERGARRRAARATLDQGKADVGSARWRVHQRVHAAFHTALVERERVRAAERTSKFSERVADVAARRLAAGETSPLPSQLAQTVVAEAKQSAIAAEQAYRAATLELAEASGWPDDSPPEPTGGLTGAHEAPPVERLLELARTQDPALRAREAAVRRARAALAAAGREGWPNPKLGVAFERESEPGGAAASIWRGTVSVPLPLWQGSGAQRVRAQAELDVAIAEAAAYRRTVKTRVKRTASAVDSSARRVKIYGSDIVPNLEKNLTLVEKAFELGEIEITEVLVARERFLRAQSTALDAYEEYYRALGELESAVGSDVEQHEHGTQGAGP